MEHTMKIDPMTERLLQEMVAKGLFKTKEEALSHIVDRAYLDLIKKEITKTMPTPN